MKTEIVDEKLAQGLASRLNLMEYKRFRDTKSCWMCGGFKHPLYVENELVKGLFELSGKFLAHLQMTHGVFPPDIVRFIAEKIYKNKEDQALMIEFYERRYP